MSGGAAAHCQTRRMCNGARSPMTRMHDSLKAMFYQDFLVNICMRWGMPVTLEACGEEKYTRACLAPDGSSLPMRVLIYCWCLPVYLSFSCMFPCSILIAAAALCPCVQFPFFTAALCPCMHVVVYFKAALCPRLHHVFIGSSLPMCSISVFYGSSLPMHACCWLF